MNYTKKEREQYNIDRDRACKRLGITKNQYNWFRREGLKLHNLYEQNCNGTISEADYDLETTAIEQRILKKAKEFALYVYFQTDPRGATIYLDKIEIPENNYTQAVCIY